MKRDILVLVMLMSVILGAIPAQILSAFMSVEGIAYLRMASIIVFVPSMAILSMMSIVSIALYLKAKRQVSQVGANLSRLSTQL
jgi:hypothetical protein